MASDLLFNVLKLYGYIFVGIIIGILFKNYKDQISKKTTQIIINFFTPIIIFLVLTTTEYDLDFVFIIQIVLLEIGSLFFCWVTTYVILIKKIDDKKKVGSYMFLNGFPNVLIYSIPIVTSFFSTELLIVPVIFASSALVMRGIFGNYIGEKLGANVKLNIKEALKKLILFPPLIGIIISAIIMISPIELPVNLLLDIKNILNPIYSGLGGILIGIILSKLSKPDIKENYMHILVVMIWRYGFSFLFFIVFIFFTQFPVDSTEIRTILMINIMGPPAVINTAFALYFGLDDKFAAISVATITLISLILLPGILAFGIAFL